MFRKVFLVTALSSLAVGALAGYAYSDAQSHDAALRASTVKKLVVQHQNDALIVTNPALTSFTTDTVPVPASGNYRALVRFSGESECNAASWCSVAIFVDGVEASPASGTDFAFDSPGAPTWVSPSVERTSHVIAGTGVVRNVTVEVRVAVVGGGNWRIDDWTAAAELFKV